MKLEKVNMTKRTLKTAANRGDYGFTAIEIAMVAAVIAILSVIVLPIFRNRVEDAKIVAAQADLSALMKAEQVVKADTGFFARLEDLDNVKKFGYTAMPAGGVNKEVPWFRYNEPRAGVSPDPQTRHSMLTLPNERQLFAVRADDEPVWRGPYIAFQNAVTYENFRNLALNPNYSNLSATGSGFQAAVQDVQANDSDESRIPVDPWGNPYMFFPPTGNQADPGVTNGAYASAAIYSMGPDGLPGDGGTAPATFIRDYTVQNPTATNALGKGDDLMVEF